MLLAVDLGNSTIRLALYEGVEQWVTAALPTSRAASAEELAAGLAGALDSALRGGARVDAVAVSSVVPDLENRLRSALRSRFSCVPEFVGRELPPPFPVRYRPPGSAGADRLANVAAALRRRGAPVIVVDCGTATNLEVAAEEGAFIGGAILPGPEAMRGALYDAAPHLPPVEIERPARVIGGTSRECLESGLYHGSVSQLRGMVEQVRAELGVAAPVIGTGGWAERLLSGQQWVDEVVPLLTLEGVRLFWAAAHVVPE